MPRTEARADAKLAPLLAAGILLAPALFAQSDEGEPLEEAAPVAVEAGTRPGEAVFEPPEQAEDSTIEEIVVVAEPDEWRLPDLGDTFRQEREALERQRRGRVQVEFLPLYDPERPEPDPDLIRMFDAERRVGTVELFRFRFGGR